MEEAVLRGRVVAPGFLDDPLLRKAWLSNIWVGPAPGQIDPVRETSAAQARVDGLFTTIADETASMGGDLDQNIPQIKKEKALKKELGVTTKKPKVEDTEAEDKEEKAKTYKKIEEYTKRFKSRNGSVACRELLGYDISTPEEMKEAKDKGLFSSICPRMVQDSVEILNEMLNE